MSQHSDNFNMNVLQNAPSEGLSGEPAGDEGSSFAAQIAGGGDNEFIIPTQKKSVSTGTIAFIAIAAVAGGGLWWMKQRTGGPAPAEAAGAEVVAARQSIQQFLAGGTGSVTEMKTLLADSSQITEKFEAFNDNHQIPLDALKTNPFYLETTEKKPVVPVVDLTRQQQEELARREAERLRLEQERLAKAASKLDVQTIFYGKTPTALIDGKICRVGQMLGEFTIIAIHPDRVEVEASGQKFDLKLKS